MIRISLFLFSIVLQYSMLSVTAKAGESSTFDSEKRPGKWAVNFGHWEPEDGVLVCRQMKVDNHAAASRWQIPMTDGTINCRFQFQGANFFHIGFDPAKGTLDKKGHLYSLVITPDSASIKKHKDKADPQSKDQTMATVKFAEPLTGWHTVNLKAEGNTVVVNIDNQQQLTATEPTFGVKKPAVVFRVGGGDLLLDDVQVEVNKP